MKVAVLYHNDADGFGAAYACWKVYGDEAIYIPVQYSQPPPDIPEGIESLFIVDFSYDRVICEALADRFGADNIRILDHHQTAQDNLSGLPYAIFDLNKSGAVLAWEYFFPDTPVPDILRYVQDRDLWRFELPDSREINAWITTLPAQFDVWDQFDLAPAKQCGSAIIAYQYQQINRALRNVRVCNLAGYIVPVVNVSENISEVGNEMCLWYPESPFSVSYCDRVDGHRSVSLRSIGAFDVSVIAKQFGGGGHRNAAGYTIHTNCCALIE